MKYLIGEKKSEKKKEKSITNGSKTSNRGNLPKWEKERTKKGNFTFFLVAFAVCRELLPQILLPKPAPNCNCNCEGKSKKKVLYTCIVFFSNGQGFLVIPPKAQISNYNYLLGVQPVIENISTMAAQCVSSTTKNSLNPFTAVVYI